MISFKVENQSKPLWHTVENSKQGVLLTKYTQFALTKIKHADPLV